MQPYAVKHVPDIVMRKAIEDLRLAMHFFVHLPEPVLQPQLKGSPWNMLGGDKGNPPLWSCHALVRALKAALPLNKTWLVKDGFFARNFSHSWLEQHVEGRRLILDLYPVGCLVGPNMVMTVGYEAYRPWASEDFDEPSELLQRQATFDAEGAIAAKAFRDFTKLIGKGP